MEQNHRKEDRLLMALGVIPVVWLALLAAPHFGNGLLSVFQGLSESVRTPFRITLCEQYHFRWSNQ